MMTDDRKKAIEYIVHEVYLPKLNQRIALLVHNLMDKWRMTDTVAKSTGLPFAMPPTKIDIADITEDLVKNLVQFEMITSKKEDKKDGQV